MVSFPNCKINLGLYITGKREDGYHNLETVFYPLGYKDALEIVRCSNDEVVFHQTGLTIAGDPAQNLCIKAWQLLKKDFPELPSVEMHLHKTIPMGAGLGGGSADGAFALKMLSNLFGLALEESRLAQYALQLGSDCPFFIYNKPCIATGRGERMEPIALDLSAYKFVLINPAIHISTAAAFAGITPKSPAISIKELISRPVTEWKASGLVNDFEPGAIQHHPVIGKIKNELYATGAIYASMTGSGSSVYGIFNRKNDVPKSAEGYSTYTIE